MLSSDPASIGKILVSETVRTHFLAGLDRVARVIDGNPDYDAIIGHKLTSDFRDRFSPSAPIEDRRRSAISELQAAIRMSKQATYALPDVDILFLGRTENNLREFSFLLDVLGRIDRKFSHFNAVDLKFSKRRHSQADLDQLVEHLTPVMVDYIDSRATLGPELVYQLGQFAVHFIRYLFSLARSDSKHPFLAIVANDHSPNPVAFSLAMKTFNIRRLYVQHAEVSTSFPPLDFEFSILRNAVSRRIYEEIGPINGDAFIISRFPEPFRYPQCNRDELGKQSVVLYTTGRVDVDGLRLVFERLRTNPHVSSVHVKPHPNQAAVEWPRGLSALNDFPVFPHIAVVANSSVVIELLHRGIPVFQNFDFDPVEPDYYGFVRSGVAGSASMDALSGAFWNQFDFDEQWYSRYADLYAPPESASESDKARFLEKISPILGHRFRPRAGVAMKYPPPNPVRSPKTKLPSYGKAIVNIVAKISSRMVLETVKYIAYESPLKARQAIQELCVSGHTSSTAADPKKLPWLQASIGGARNPSEWLCSTLAIGIVDHEDAIKAIDQLYLSRHPVVFTLFDHVDDLEEHLAVYLWLSFKRFEVTGVALPYPLDGMIDAILDVPNRRFVRLTLEGLAFNACLRENRLDLLDLLFEKALRVRHETLSTTRRIALLRHLIRTGNIEKYEKARKEFWEAETPFHRLKIADVDNVFGTRHCGSTHEQTELAFENEAPSAIAAEFKANIKPVYTRLRHGMRFMDVRSNAEERKHFQQVVVDAIQEKKPLSMIRLSDGEGYAFAEHQEFFTLDDQLNRERHWWGIELETELRSSITARIRAAVDHADILGIPAIHRFVRDIHQKSTTFKASVQGRGLLQVLHYFSNRPSSALFGEEKMNVPLFRSHEAVREMLIASQHCVLVSSANISQLPDWMRGLTSMSHVTIPTHFRTSRNEKYHASDQPLPLVYEAINEEIRRKTSPGTLVLIAGGIVGKIFIGTAKEAGGVALDLGSVMDEWLEAGIHSLH
ncbi:conserved hypothetical protein (plasmid) [Sinorhizobium fredii NGR234]|uniref:Putative capsular polysaccharide synthesis n=1 Tax=Sinorhizobium fredii (strain NBRC 101917 / NGR234) TaxID=394 RepID=Q071E3_SINFN|nr:hypothetical protein [Sinorhizobium fredii]ABD15249.1 putative capsular polysaccharide synthesis [Sinorhizobium fredii NGR234]ACP22395.1 conserved hypothetical protein [Sinorhizobium fredii NGR234]